MINVRGAHTACTQKRYQPSSFICLFYLFIVSNFFGFHPNSRVPNMHITGIQCIRYLLKSALYMDLFYYYYYSFKNDEKSQLTKKWQITLKNREREKRYKIAFDMVFIPHWLCAHIIQENELSPMRIENKQRPL